MARVADPIEARIDRLGSLRDPVRRALYLHARRVAPEELSRDAAAAALGITRSLAAFHLDRLVDAGLLEPVYKRLSGRSGPGAGRPAKLYRPSARPLEVTLPPRRYELAARGLAEGLGLAPDRPAGEPARAAARRLGEALGRDAGSEDGGTPLLAALNDLGFEPLETEPGVIRLRNCPFHELAEDYRTPVCDLNLALQEGLLRGLAGGSVRAALEPRPGWCCVAFRSGEAS